MRSQGFEVGARIAAATELQEGAGTIVPPLHHHALIRERIVDAYVGPPPPLGVDSIRMDQTASDSIRIGPRGKREKGLGAKGDSIV